MLREANKALSLYVARILDRITASDGFEHILAKDAPMTTSRSAHSSADSGTGNTPRVPRPTSIAYHRSSVDMSSMSMLPSQSQSPQPPFPSASSSPQPQTNPSPPRVVTLPTAQERKKTQRLSLTGVVASLWSSQSSASKSPQQPPGFKPMLLGTNVGPLTTAPPPHRRQLDNEEDEEDARERARLKAEMRLHGIDTTTRSPNIWSAESSPAIAPPALSRSTSVINGPTPPPKDVVPPMSPALRATELREKEQKAEIAQGRASGFTEIRGHRRRPSSQSSVGLGLSGVEAVGSTGSGSRPGSSASNGRPMSLSMSRGPSATEEATKEKDEEGWAKKFRRMSSSFGA